MARLPPSRIDQPWRAPRSRRRRGSARAISGRTLCYAFCLVLLLGCYGPAMRDRFTDAFADMPFGVGSSEKTMSRPDPFSARFGLCHGGGGRVDCVVDGDTFWFQGRKYRIADIDTPETHAPRCAAEGEHGTRATARLRALMNGGSFSLESGARDTDRYGRALRVVTRDGESIGAMLVAEGLARPWNGARRPWCPDGSI